MAEAKKPLTNPLHIVAAIHDLDRCDSFLWSTHEERVKSVTTWLTSRNRPFDEAEVDAEMRRMAPRYWQKRPRRLTGVSVVEVLPASPGDMLRVPPAVDGPPARHRIEGFAVLSDGRIAAMLILDDQVPRIYDISECEVEKSSRQSTEKVSGGSAGSRGGNGRRRLAPLEGS